MMDLLMAGLLAGCAGLVLVLLNWCHRQVSPGPNREEHGMIVLGIIVLLLGGYLFYALVHPENF